MHDPDAQAAAHGLGVDPDRYRTDPDYRARVRASLGDLSAVPVEALRVLASLRDLAQTGGRVVIGERVHDLTEHELACLIGSLGADVLE